MPYKYLQRVSARRQNTGTGSDVQTGLQVGQQVGKLIGGLAGAIKGAQRDAVANQLMDAQAIGDQPGAGVTQDLGRLGDDSGSSSAAGATQDLGPVDQDPDADTDDLSSAIAAARLGSGPTVGSAGEPQPGAQPSADSDFSLSDLPASGPTNRNTVGSLIHTGGVDEMKLRQEATKADLQNQALAAEIAQRKAAVMVAGTRARGGGGVNIGGGSGSAWIKNRAEGGQPSTGGSTAGQPRVGKPQPYQANSSDVQNDESSDDFTKIGSDFDATYGQKGLYGKYAANLSNLNPDEKGNFPLLDAKGQPIATVPAVDAPVWMARTNAARVKSGLQPIGQPAPASNPTANAPAGTLTNPYAPKDNLGIRAIPYGQYLIDPATGKVVQKNRPAAQ